MLRHLSFGIVVSALAMGGCSSTSGGGGPSDAAGDDASDGAADGADASDAQASCPTDWAGVQAAIFARSCATSGCHEATSLAGGLDLASPNVGARLVDVPSLNCSGQILVVPGAPGSSLLVHKVADATPPCGARMPMGQPPLADADIACLRAFVAGLPKDDAGADGGASDASDAADAGSDAVASCPSGQTFCGSGCVDTNTNASDCGGCGHACGVGQTCVAGACTCGSPQTLCGTICVDTKTDVANCGSCGHACGAGQVCSAGACASSCPSGTTSCSGSCVDLQTSGSNCGACGTTCSGGTSCVSGSCQCPSGSTLCSGTCVSTATDPSHCGSCTTVCPSGATCASGACACPSGETTCGAACTNTSTDASNCGSCGHACPSGQVCSGGTCSCGASVSFSASVQPIFTSSCAVAGCHTGVVPAQGLNLSTGKSYADLVNVTATECTSGEKRVAPGQVSASYLWNKLTGTALCSGTPMPKTGGTLPSPELAAIQAWICEGAPNN